MVEVWNTQIKLSSHFSPWYKISKSLPSIPCDPTNSGFIVFINFVHVYTLKLHAILCTCILYNCTPFCSRMYFTTTAHHFLHKNTLQQLNTILCNIYFTTTAYHLCTIYFTTARHFLHVHTLQQLHTILCMYMPYNCTPFCAIYTLQQLHATDYHSRLGIAILTIFSRVVCSVVGAKGTEIFAHISPLKGGILAQICP